MAGLLKKEGIAALCCSCRAISHRFEATMKPSLLLVLLFLAQVTIAGHINSVPPVADKAAKASADTLTITSFETIKKEQIPKTAMIGSDALTRTGTGMRAKKILFVNIDVYQATLFVSDINKFARNTSSFLALDSLSSMKAYSLILNFKR